MESMMTCFLKFEYLPSNYNQVMLLELKYFDIIELSSFFNFSLHKYLVSKLFCTSFSGESIVAKNLMLAVCVAKDSQHPVIYITIR